MRIGSRCHQTLVDGRRRPTIIRARRRCVVRGRWVLYKDTAIHLNPAATLASVSGVSRPSARSQSPPTLPGCAERRAR